MMIANEIERGYDRLLSEAVAALKSGRLESAELSLKLALSADYARPEVFNVLGVLMEIRRDQAKAQNYYRAALALDPTYSPAARNLDRTVRFGGDNTWDLGKD